MKLDLCRKDMVTGPAGEHVLRDVKGIISIGQVISKKSVNIHTHTKKKRKRKRNTCPIEIPFFFSKFGTKTVSQSKNYIRIHKYIYMHKTGKLLIFA